MLRLREVVVARFSNDANNRVPLFSVAGPTEPDPLTYRIDTGPCVPCKLVTHDCRPMTLGRVFAAELAPTRDIQPERGEVRRTDNFEVDQRIRRAPLD